MPQKKIVETKPETPKREIPKIDPLDENRKKSRSILLESLLQGMKQDEKTKSLAKSTESEPDKVHHHVVLRGIQ